MHVPTTLKRRLVDLSRFLAPDRRAGFLRGVVDQLENLALSYPRTLVFALAGSIAGGLLEAILGFGGFLGFLAGGLYGLHRDIYGGRAEREISRVIGEQLFEAHNSSSR